MMHLNLPSFPFWVLVTQTMSRTSDSKQMYQRKDREQADELGLRRLDVPGQLA